MTTEIEQNLVNLLESGNEANVLLAFQLQRALKSPLFEKKLRRYQSLTQQQ